MGLDMYLKGKIFNWTNWEKPEGERRPMKDGFEVSEIIIELGYWRKHPNLHGFIVNTFAKGVDDCQEIDLSIEDIQQTIKAIRETKLPSTQGFFFGKSDGSEDLESIQILEKAIEWEKARPKGESRSISYRASW